MEGEEHQVSVRGEKWHLLLSTVVDGGYCIGCGACAVSEESPIRIVKDEIGRYQAVLAHDVTDVMNVTEGLEVCPFSGHGANEDQIGESLFPEAPRQDSFLGRHHECFVGYVEEGAFRQRGSSGGLAKWILAELLAQGLGDKVIQVMEGESGDAKLYKFAVMDSVEQVVAGAKSVYYPVEMSEVLQHVAENQGRYAITGVPCFIKAVRLLGQANHLFAERIRYTIGIVCGHLKTSRYAEMLGWQLGVPPTELASIDFRKKLPGRRANEKGVRVTSIKENAEVKPDTIVQNLFGSAYALSFMQYRACEFCDDVVGETADVSVGDAWLPEFVEDGRGASVLIVRNAKILELLRNGISNNRLSLKTIESERAAESQEAGFRQRREGLAYRLWLADRKGVWRPPKRVESSADHISTHRRKIYELRSQLAASSHTAFAKARERGSFEVFQQEMSTLVRKYRLLSQGTMLNRIRARVSRKARGILGYFKN